MEVLLSVAVGSQLADVFLHLLPEAFAHSQASSMSIGLWTLVGLFVFFLIEQIFPEDQQNSTTKVLHRICNQKFLWKFNFRMKMKIQFRKRERSK